MAESGDGRGVPRERSREHRGRSTTRERDRGSEQPQGIDPDRVERLESQVNRLSDVLLSLGPTLQQIMQFQSQSSAASSSAGLPNAGLPTGAAQPQQLPIPPMPTSPPPQMPPTNPELVPNTTPMNQAPFGSTAPHMTNHPEVGTPNQTVDPLQSNDPWRNFQFPSQAAGVSTHPFPTSMPAAPDRIAHPFAPAQTGPAINVPPPPGISIAPSTVGQPPIQIDTPQGSHHDQVEDNPFKRSEKWMPNVPTPSVD